MHCVAEAFNDDKVQVVCGRSRLFQHGDETVSYSRGTDIYANNLAKTVGRARIDQPETFFRKSAIDEIGLLNPELHYAMDKEWWIRYLLRHGLSGIRSIDNILVNFRLHAGSKTVSSKSLFEIDTDRIYYELANSYGLHDYGQLIKENFDTEYVTSAGLTGFDSTYADLVEKALNYYLLLKADTYYSRNKWEKAKTLLDKVDENKLATEDRKTLSKLKI